MRTQCFRLWYVHQKQRNNLSIVCLDAYLCEANKGGHRWMRSQVAQKTSFLAAKLYRSILIALPITKRRRINRIFSPYKNNKHKLKDLSAEFRGERLS